MNFKFYNSSEQKPKRVLILGSTGIISCNLQNILKKKNINFLTIGRLKLDFKKKDAKKILRKKIKKNDVVIFIAAEAPVKNVNMFANNLKICETICDALESKKITHLIYISSDAIYADIKGKISEKTNTLPSSLHGLMHLTREAMLKNKFSEILCILRPTLIYGNHDTHNGYGPNRFKNLALKNEPISIFGNGEEKRDHIFIDDVVKIIFKCITKRGLGILNLASGQVYSFRYLAELTINLTMSRSKLFKVKRAGPMPHNGYRPFDIRRLRRHFKNIGMFPIKAGIKKYLNYPVK